jgi:hypothetical protein
MTDSPATTYSKRERMKIYVCGPMTGIEDFNRPAFNEAARLLRGQGYEVVNPAEFEQSGSWEWLMRYAIAQMLTCDRIALLDGWNKSRGAKLEVHVAREVGIRIETLLEVFCDGQRKETNGNNKLSRDETASG